MISYNKFKELFTSLKSDAEVEIFIDNYENEQYILIKYNEYLTFGKVNASQKEIKRYSSLDELYNKFLKKNWNRIIDILIDTTFSVIDNKQEIKNYYDINL